jgi:hypothetical protein
MTTQGTDGQAGLARNGEHVMAGRAKNSSEHILALYHSLSQGERRKFCAAIFKERTAPYSEIIDHLLAACRALIDEKNRAHRLEKSTQKQNNELSKLLTLLQTKFGKGPQTRRERTRRRNELVLQALSTGIANPARVGVSKSERQKEIQKIHQFIKNEDAELLKGREGEMTPESVWTEFKHAMNKSSYCNSAELLQ